MTRITMRPTEGFTLTEIMVAMVVAGLATLFLVGFYLNSQATWIDASTQALAQRDATHIVETITDRAHEAGSVQIESVPDAEHQTVILLSAPPNPVELARFWWNPDNSLIHYSTGPTIVDHGPVAPSRVARFTLAANDSLLYLTSLQVRSANGRDVEITSAIGLYNR